MDTAAIYARISTKDERTGYNVEKTADQIERLKKLAADRDFPVYDVYEDDGISAAKAGQRPQFDRMLADLALGRFKVILATEDERLARNDLEGLGLKLACAEHGARWETCRGGVTDPTTASGGFMASVKNAVSTYETKHKAERQRDENENTRAKGMPYRSGARPFGWNGDRITQRPDEAALVIAGKDAILSGATLYSVFRSWQASGVTPVNRDHWTRASVRSVLTRGSNAAVVEHRGEFVRDGAETWRRNAMMNRVELGHLRIILSKNATGTRNCATTLLTGIARCACGEPMVGNGRQARPPMYVCSARMRGRQKPEQVHAAIAQHLLDGEVRRCIVTLYLFAPMQSSAIADAGARLAVLHENIAALVGKLDRIEDLYLDGAMNKANHTRKRADVDARLHELRARLAEEESASAHSQMLVQTRADLLSANRLRLSDAAQIKTDLFDAFDSLTVERRRQLVAATLRIIAGPGRGLARVMITGDGLPAADCTD